jgi:hypothetical protein
MEKVLSFLKPKVWYDLHEKKFPASKLTALYAWQKEPQFNLIYEWGEKFLQSSERTWLLLRRKYFQQSTSFNNQVTAAFPRHFLLVHGSSGCRSVTSLENIAERKNEESGFYFR